MDDHYSFMLKSASISIMNSLAVGISFLPQVEQWLRITSLLTAITYTVILMAKALTKKKSK